MKKRIVSALFLILSLSIVGIFLQPAPAHAALPISYGSCGDNLTWVYDTDNVLTISGSGDMYDFSDENPAPWSDWSEYIKVVYIEYGATSIGDFAFYYCYNISEVTLPNSLLIIGEEAFSNCEKLVNITIPNSVTTIDRYAFLWCFNLTSISLPDNVSYIGEGAFQYCTKLSNISIPGSLSHIESQTFLGCSSLESIVIPDHVTTIGNGAFMECSNLLCIVLSENVHTIEKDAFNYCSNLWHVLFTGSEQKWNNISIGSRNTNLANAIRHYNCTGAENINLSTKDCPICNPRCNHEWINATCTKPKTCSLCGIIEGSPTGHNYNAVVTAPNCTEQGYTTHTCTCGDVYVDTYTDPLGHSYTSTITVPTCTEQGYTTHTCSCGNSFTDSYAEETGHNWDNGQITTEPNCVENGVIVYTCALCQETKTETIDKTGVHSYDNDQDNSCNICGELRQIDVINPQPSEPEPTSTTTMPNTESTTPPTTNEENIDNLNEQPNTSIGFVAIIVIACLLCGAILFFIFQKRK